MKRSFEELKQLVVQVLAHYGVEGGFETPTSALILTDVKGETGIVLRQNGRDFPIVVAFEGEDFDAQLAELYAAGRSLEAQIGYTYNRVVARHSPKEDTE